MGHCKIQLKDQTLTLHPFKAIFWEEHRTLLLADLHLGKVGHFRRAGIPVPRAASDANWDRLYSLLFDLKPSRVFFLGDLFHSDYNPEWEDLGQLIRQFSSVDFTLVQGNHDILPGHCYEEAGIRVREEGWQVGPFWLTHHPVAEPPPGLYNLAGHIHPGVLLRGMGKFKKKVPCFYFGEKAGLLPAFGTFTGLASVRSRKGDRVFVLAGEEVLEV